MQFARCVDLPLIRRGRSIVLPSPPEAPGRAGQQHTADDYPCVERQLSGSEDILEATVYVPISTGNEYGCSLLLDNSLFEQNVDKLGPS